MRNAASQTSAEWPDWIRKPRFYWDDSDSDDDSDVHMDEHDLEEGETLDDKEPTEIPTTLSYVNTAEPLAIAEGE